MLGFYAESIDLRDDDQKLQIRPTSIGVAGLVQELTLRVVELGLGAIFLPFYCIPKIFSHGLGLGACSRDAFDLAREANPAEHLLGLIPGVGRYTNEDFAGFFHFVDVSADANNRYNSPRGLFYENAGPTYPGAIDVGIMIASDLLGITLAPDSNGIELYGKYDRVVRTESQWQAHTIGHTEFSSVSNLGRAGWDTFDGLEASSLAFPLHAIGDAAAPHHVVGTTSWGHRPFEDAVADQEDGLLLRTGAVGFTAQQARVLQIAYGALLDFDRDPSIANFINREAFNTRAIAKNDDDWAFKDTTSVEYFVWPNIRSSSIDVYRDRSDRLRPFTDQAIGQTVAFLIKAGERSTGFASPDDITLCPAGSYYTGQYTGAVLGCTPGRPPERPEASLPLSIAQTACGDTGASCTAARDCCGALTCSSGRCATAPPVCGSTGATCAAGADCCSGLTCNSGQCGTPGPTCATLGASCAGSPDCCAPLACRQGQCAPCLAACTGEGESAQCGGSICFRGCCQISGPN